jgi:dihydropteroate synthase
VGRLTGSEAARALESGLALPGRRRGESYSLIELLQRRPDGGADRSLHPAQHCRAAFPATAAERLDCFAGKVTTPLAPWAGFSLAQPLIMGVVNVTPDSFSDGGAFLDPTAAIDQGRALLAAGADLLDIGGESTRPGALPVDPATEAARIVPVIQALAEAGATLSVDTRRPSVMAAALDAGARIVNDVTALADDAALALVAARRVPVVLMHMQGEPRTMQAEPRYDVPALDLFDFFETRLAACRAAGIVPGAILIDPGIGFGKTLEHNLALLRDLALFEALGHGILLGLSRKSFIGTLSGEARPSHRLAGSLAGALHGLARGAELLRVHDVGETRQALKLIAALEQDDFRSNRPKI